jgi:hypothetical protein
VPLAIGALLAFAVGLLATGIGLDRDRAFYPVVAIVIASYYALFAVMGGSTLVLVPEVLIGTVFLVISIWGFRSSLWLVVAALAAHGILDLGHRAIISNPGVPPWWPRFCLAYDITAAVYLAWQLKSGRIRAAADVASRVGLWEPPQAGGPAPRSAVTAPSGGPGLPPAGGGPRQADASAG